VCLDPVIFVASCAHDEFVSGPGFSSVAERMSVLYFRARLVMIFSSFYIRQKIQNFVYKFLTLS
jgi:hypothetical protein